MHSPRTPTDLRSRFEIALIVVGGLVLLAPSRLAFGDGLVRMHSLATLMTAHRFDEAKYSLVGPMFAAPLWYLGGILGDPARICGYFNWVLLMAGLASLFLLLRPHVPPPTLRRFLLVLTCASMFGFATRTFYGETFSALLVTIGLILVSTRRALPGWLIIVLGVVNTQALIPCVAAASVIVAVSEKRLRHLLVLPAAVGLFLAENYVRRGTLLTTGYEGDHGLPSILPYAALPGFSYPMVFGVLSILLSFGRGLVFFAPGLLLSGGPSSTESEALRRVFRMWLLFVGMMVLLYSRWWAWSGRCYWGPRFFLIASVPASFAIASSLALTPKRTFGLMAQLAVLTLSFWVGADGAIFGLYKQEVCCSGLVTDALCDYLPEMGSLASPFVYPRALTGREWVVAIHFAIVYLWLALPLMRELFTRLLARGRHLVVNLDLRRYDV